MAEAAAATNHHREYARREAAQRELARRHILPFIMRFKSNYEVGWVHKVFAAKVEQFYHDVKAGKQPRLMVFVPPRHGKSEIISRSFPAWALGQDPELEIIMSSYSIDLPREFSKVNRERIQDPKYRALFPETELDPKSTNAENWMTTRKGIVKAIGTSGGASGFGANIFIIDDPIKDFDDAQSETLRESVKNWYTTVADNRLLPQSGVIIVQCMTGDTSVLMPDGSERRLDTIRPGDIVASYDQGRMVASKVLNWKSQGHDSVFRITTSSGRVVKANERHPFLVDDAGERKWVRVKNLRSGQKIVIAPVSGESGKARSAKLMDVSSQPNAEASATATTINGDGLRDTARRLHRKIPVLGSALSSSIATASRLTNMSRSWLIKTANALCAKPHLTRRTTQAIGPTSCVSTTATTPVGFADFFATDVTSQSAVGTRRRSLTLQQRTFETDEIVSIEPAGVEEVFDIQVEHTENFIANGLVSHNTRWHDDDLAGWRLRVAQELKNEGVPEDEIEQWEVVSFPAIAEADEYLDENLNIQHEHAPGHVLVRHQGEALHEPRYPKKVLLRKKHAMPSQQWSALFQQNPVPDSGEFFTKDDFVFYDSVPVLHDYPVMFAWDLAVGEKRTNDWTVGIAGALIPHDGLNTLYILDMFRARVRDVHLYQAVVNMYLKYKQNAARIGMEYGQLFLSVERPILREFRKRGITPVWDRDLRPINDKRVRATPAAGWMQHHRIKWPRHANWTDTAMAELLRFDAGVHDDIVDALAWLVRMAEKMPTITKHSERRKDYKSVKDRIRDYARNQDSGSGFMSA